MWKHGSIRWKHSFIRWRHSWPPVILRPRTTWSCLLTWPQQSAFILNFMAWIPPAKQNNSSPSLISETSLYLEWWIGCPGAETRSKWNGWQSVRVNHVPEAAVNKKWARKEWETWFTDNVKNTSYRPWTCGTTHHYFPIPFKKSRRMRNSWYKWHISKITEKKSRLSTFNRNRESICRNLNVLVEPRQNTVGSTVMKGIIMKEDGEVHIC